MAEAKDRLDLAALSYRFSQLTTLCAQLEDLTKQPKYAKAVCQRILVNLRDEFKLIDIALEGDMRSIIAQFGITPRELYILTFRDKDRLLKKAFRNDQESIVELVSTVRTSISLWKTRIIGVYEKSNTTEMGGKTNTIAEAHQAAPSSEWKAPFGKNIHFKQSLLGEVEIKYISFGDTYTIMKFLDETNFRRFATLIVHNQLAQPKSSLEEIEAWPEDVLVEICSKLLENETTIKGHFHRNTERSFFEDFHQAFAESLKEQVERLKATEKEIQSQLSGLVKKLAPIVNTPGLKIAMQALSTYDFRFLSESIHAIQNMARFVKPLNIPIVRPVWLDSPFIQPPEYSAVDIVGEIEVSKGTIGVLLGNISPDLERKRQGAWETFYGKSPDRISQAIHSMREVLRQLLNILGPAEEIKKAPWYVRPTKGAAVTRRMRVRYALAGVNTEVSESTLKLTDSFADTVEKTYEKLSAEAHMEVEAKKAKTEAYLDSCEAIILLLLVHRSA